MIADRENLTTEVWRLKQELDRSLGPAGRCVSPGPDELDHFDPNNPRALRRKISKYHFVLTIGIKMVHAWY